MAHQAGSMKKNRLFIFTENWNLNCFTITDYSPPLPLPLPSSIGAGAVKRGGWDSTFVRVMLGSVSDPYLLNPDPAKNLNPDPNPEDP